MKSTLISCILCLLLAGCTTVNNFQNIPGDPADFRNSPEDIRRKYPEIALYEKHFRGFSFNTPPQEDLVEQWGQPQKVDTRWGYATGMIGALAASTIVVGGTLASAVIVGAMVAAIRPYPPQDVYWVKDRYCIEAYTERTIDHPYVSRVVYWKWHDLEGDGEAKNIKGCQLPYAGVATDKAGD